MDWLCKLSCDQQERIIKMAVKRRAHVARLYKEEEARRSEQRRKQLAEVHSREVMKQKTMEKLSNLHLITSSDELLESLSEIDGEEITSKQKRQKKLAIIREQLKIRTKVLKQKIKIPFTVKGKQRSLPTIIQEFTDYINDVCQRDQTTPNPRDYTSDSIVGKKILHKFEVNGKDKWFTGYVVNYNTCTHLHEVTYDEEENFF